MKISVLRLACISLALLSCKQPKPDSSQKHYSLSGTVVSVNVKEKTANIDGAAIPDFMGAMKMDYPVPSEAELASLKAGENITATVNVSEDGSYTLSDIHERPASGK